jgi:2-dehydro-3-deoxygluconokinase
LLSRVIDVARAHHLHIVFDVNYRALLWSPQECSAKLDPLIRQVSTLILSKRDAEGVFGIQGDAPATLKALRDRFGVAQIALTVGEHGAVALNGDDIFSAPGYTVHMVDRIGAGDSFAAGVISGLLEGDFALGVRYGVAMSALQLTLAGDIFRLERSDVLRLMNAGAGTRLVR